MKVGTHVPERKDPRFRAGRGVLGGLGLFAGAPLRAGEAVCGQGGVVTTEGRFHRFARDRDFCSALPIGEGLRG